MLNETPGGAHRRLSWLLCLVLLVLTRGQGQVTIIPLFPSRAPVTLPPSTPSPVTASPTDSPTTLTPTISTEPSTSFQPSNIPTTTPRPTPFPTQQPSLAPTLPGPHLPSRANLRQDFFLNDCDDEVCIFNLTQIETIVEILEGFTSKFNVDTSRVDTLCDVEAQTNEQEALNQTEVILKTVLDYGCTYTSKQLEVQSFPDQLATLINGKEPPTFLMMLVQQELPVREVEDARVRIVQTPSPTLSSSPSLAPSGAPTTSAAPSVVPSAQPSHLPSENPVSTMPFSATNEPGPSSIEGKNLLAMVIPIAAIGGLAVLFGLFFLYRSAKKNARSLPYYTPTPASGNSTGRWSHDDDDDNSTDRNEPSASESHHSRKSLLSKGESCVGEESGDEQDGTKDLLKEFVEIKNQAMEQPVESQVATDALMGDEDAHVDTQGLLWGCSSNSPGTELEASALFEVSDWIKRNESASGERKRAFMQEILNKMVTSVRFGVLSADVASRTIHESAAILGIPLAEELPATTVVISGMRKKTTANDMIRALREFGDIDVAAVASGRRGFGIVRFRRQKSLERALRRYRSGEIVILDVSIQMKVIAEDKFLGVDN